MEQVKPALNEKCEFKYADESIIALLENSGWNHSDAKIRLVVSSIKSSSTSAKDAIEIFVDVDFNKATDVEKFENNQHSWHFSEHWDCQSFDARIKMNVFSINNLFTSSKLALDISMEKMEPVGTRKSQFEYRDKSMFIAFFEFSWQSSFWFKYQNELILKKTSSFTCVKCSIVTLDRKIKPAVRKIHEF